MDGSVLINSVFLALGLALESFMVALAMGLCDANTRIIRALMLAVVFAVCHAVALYIGYALISKVSESAQTIEKYLTWIAVAVLVFLGVKSIVKGVRAKKDGKMLKQKKTAQHVFQSIVASFDAFAVGLTVGGYSWGDISVCAAVIASVIIVFYLAGFAAGKKFGMKFNGVAAILGGLVFIGLAAEVTIEYLLS